MANHQRAQIVPYSSIVGSSVTLHHPEEGYCEAQLAILGVGGNPGEDHKSRQIAIATEVAEAINERSALKALLREALETWWGEGDGGEDIDIVTKIKAVLA